MFTLCFNGFSIGFSKGFQRSKQRKFVREGFGEVFRVIWRVFLEILPLKKSKDNPKKKLRKYKKNLITTKKK